MVNFCKAGETERRKCLISKRRGTTKKPKKALAWGKSPSPLPVQPLNWANFPPEAILNQCKSIFTPCYACRAAPALAWIWLTVIHGWLQHCPCFPVISHKLHTVTSSWTSSFRVFLRQSVLFDLNSWSMPNVFRTCTLDVTQQGQISSLLRLEHQYAILVNELCVAPYAVTQTSLWVSSLSPHPPTNKSFHHNKAGSAHPSSWHPVLWLPLTVFRSSQRNKGWLCTFL